jgi:hypothetical protein
MSDDKRAPLAWQDGEAGALGSFLTLAWRTTYDEPELAALTAQLQRMRMTYRDALDAADRLIEEGHRYPPTAADLAGGRARLRESRRWGAGTRSALPRSTEVAPPWYGPMVAAALLAAAGKREPAPADPSPAWEPWLELARELDLEPRDLCDDEPEHDPAVRREAEASFAALWERLGRPAMAGQALAVVSRRRRRA